MCSTHRRKGCWVKSVRLSLVLALCHKWLVVCGVFVPKCRGRTGGWRPSLCYRPGAKKDDGWRSSVFASRREIRDESERLQTQPCALSPSSCRQPGQKLSGVVWGLRNDAFGGAGRVLQAGHGDRPFLVNLAAPQHASHKLVTLDFSSCLRRPLSSPQSYVKKVPALQEENHPQSFSLLTKTHQHLSQIQTLRGRNKHEGLLLSRGLEGGRPQTEPTTDC